MNQVSCHAHHSRRFLLTSLLVHGILSKVPRRTGHSQSAMHQQSTSLMTPYLAILYIELAQARIYKSSTIRIRNGIISRIISRLRYFFSRTLNSNSKSQSTEVKQSSATFGVEQDITPLLIEIVGYGWFRDIPWASRRKRSRPQHPIPKPWISGVRLSFVGILHRKSQIWSCDCMRYLRDLKHIDSIRINWPYQQRAHSPRICPLACPPLFSSSSSFGHSTEHRMSRTPKVALRVLQDCLEDCEIEFVLISD